MQRLLRSKQHQRRRSLNQHNGLDDGRPVRHSTTLKLRTVAMLLPTILIPIAPTTIWALIKITIAVAMI